MDLTQVVKNITLTKVCSIKADKDATESKNITLKVAFNDVTLNDVFTKALSQTVIQWQNGVGRKKFTSFSNNEIVKVNFKAPAVTTIDPEAAMIANLKSMSGEERAEYIKALVAKANEISAE